VNGSVLMLADVTPEVLGVLKKSGALDIVGEQNVFPASPRVLETEKVAWEAGQRWLQQRAAASPGIGAQGEA
jgi:hypothetical protein